MVTLGIPYTPDLRQTGLGTRFVLWHCRRTVRRAHWDADDLAGSRVAVAIGVIDGFNCAQAEKFGNWEPVRAFRQTPPLTWREIIAAHDVRLTGG